MGLRVVDYVLLLAAATVAARVVLVPIVITWAVRHLLLRITLLLRIVAVVLAVAHLRLLMQLVVVGWEEQQVR